MSVARASLSSPIGLIELEADATCLLRLKITPLGTAEPTSPPHPILDLAVEQIQAYFAGQRRHFTVPLARLSSQRGEALRSGICNVDYGETLTYGALALKCGSAARAIGQACRTNPFPIIVPCHRIISAAGPEFYSGGEGPRTKAWLLDFEYQTLPRSAQTRLL
jgi:methylated-DNA-[protein]-cysteine S-methyltransferase